MKSNVGIKGSICAQVFGPDGKLKKRKLNLSIALKALWLCLTQKAISFKEMLKMIQYEYAVNHNIVTSEGDALIADLMQETPERTKVNNANGEIGVGDGFSAETKAVDALVNIIDVEQGMEATYPKTKGNWAAPDDAIVQYRTIFAAGEATGNGLDEALLGNGTDTLAYAEIAPVVNKAAPDTLQIDWELTFLGS